jgi:hypothetical protein
MSATSASVAGGPMLMGGELPPSRRTASPNRAQLSTKRTKLKAITSTSMLAPTPRSRAIQRYNATATRKAVRGALFALLLSPAASLPSSISRPWRLRPNRVKGCRCGYVGSKWAAPRIHGELLKLGTDVGQTTVAKSRRPPSQGWRTFVHNHADAIASIDMFVVPTISFGLLYGLLILLQKDAGSA